MSLEMDVEKVTSDIKLLGAAKETHRPTVEHAELV
jgi:hypothetical protein